MPRERATPGGSKETPQNPEKSFAEQRDALFDEIIARKDKRVLMSKCVFAYSTEDGMKLGERLGLTPAEYQRILLDPHFQSKHLKIASTFADAVKNIDPQTTDKYEKSFAELHVSLTAPDNWQNNARRKFLHETETQKRIDDLYLKAFMQRRAPKLAGTKEHAHAPTISKGTRMAENYLEDIGELHERRYYTGPIKEHFKNLGLENDSRFQQPTVLEDTVRVILMSKGIDEVEALKSLEPARYVAYRPIDAAKRAAITQVLSKELREALPEGLKLELNFETDEYEIKNENEETPERKKELADKFEGQALDALEKLLEEGGDVFVVASALAGFDSPRAWKIREDASEKLFREIHDAERDEMLPDEEGWPSNREFVDWRAIYADADRLGESLGCLDSPQAWDFRNRLFLGNRSALAYSLKGIDSTRAWETRERLLMTDGEAVGESLIGLDTPKAWEMRERIRQEQSDKDASLDFAMLRGLDSPRAWKEREASYELVLSGLGGIDSPRAWELRERALLFGNIRDLLESLRGLDSPRAWEIRKSLFDPNNKTMSEGLADSLRGVTSAEADQFRKLIEPYVPLDTLALSYAGEGETYLWKKKFEPLATEKHEDQSERLHWFDEQMVEELKKSFDAGDDPITIAFSLAGLDTPSAWRLREDLLKSQKAHKAGKGFTHGLITGLAGCDSDKAWELRNEIQKRNKYGSWNDELTKSIIGLDSTRAWEMRSELAALGADVVQSLAGIDTPRAWEMRNAKNTPEHSRLISIRGIDTPQAWEIREAVLARNTDIATTAVRLSLLGLNSPRAWELRQQWLNESPHNLSAFGESLIGLDTTQAWDMRQRLVDGRGEQYEYRRSLLGLDSERAMHARQVHQKIYNIGGGSDIFIWRLRKPPFVTDEESKVNISPDNKHTLELLNTVRHPSQEAIEKHFLGRQTALSPPAGTGKLTSRQRESLMRDPFSDPEMARALLETNPAVPDRAPEQLAAELLRRMLPSRVEKPSFFRKIGSYFKSSPERPPVATLLAEQPSLELAGGGAEDLADKRGVIESRNEMDELLVGGIYGSYNRDTKRWEKTYFPAIREITGPTRTDTLSLADVKGLPRAVLQLPLDGRLIKERVKGIVGKKELALTAVADSLGEVTVEIPNDVTRISYSVERPLVPEPMGDPSDREFEAFVKKLSKDYGKDLAMQLARLPHDIDAEIRSPEFKKLSPKEKVQRIEAGVRALGWYDEKNNEVSADKLGKSPEEQIALCEKRVDDLRKKNAKIGDKRFAGVCTDFAQITCAALRAAGIPSGVLTGFHLKGKTAEMKDAHATAFVPWPDGNGGIRIISVDGTPTSGTTPRTADIPRPTIAERETQSQETSTAEVAQAEEVVKEAIKAANAGDEKKLQELQNGKLERALNVILRLEVKQSHLHAIKAMFDVYWYGGLARRDRMEAEVELRKALEDEIAKERREASLDLGDPGTELFKTVRTFLGKFQKETKASSRDEGFKTLDRIFTLAKGELNDVERRALIATIAYLKAERMG